MAPARGWAQCASIPAASPAPWSGELRGSSAPAPLGPRLSPSLPLSLHPSSLPVMLHPGLLRAVPSGRVPGATPAPALPWRNLPGAPGAGTGPLESDRNPGEPPPEEAPVLLMPLEEEQADCCDRCLISMRFYTCKKIKKSIKIKAEHVLVSCSKRL